MENLAQDARQGRTQTPFRFWEVFEHWRALGYLIVPARPDQKRPAVTGWGKFHEPSRPALPTQNDFANLEWLWPFETWGDRVLPFLLLAGHPTRPLVAVDVDPPSRLKRRRSINRTIQLYGDSSMKVWTHRGVHLFYRGDPNQKVTSRACVEGSNTYDVKAWGGGVMAPGAFHPSGTEYHCKIDGEHRWPTAEDLDRLPLFNNDLYEERNALHHPERRRPNAKGNNRPPTASDWVYEEPIPNTALVELRKGERRPIKELRSGTKLLSPWRHDNRPGVDLVRDSNGRLWICDWVVMRRAEVIEDPYEIEVRQGNVEPMADVIRRRLSGLR